MAANLDQDNLVGLSQVPSSQQQPKVVHAVFNTTELLELIVLVLPPEDIVLAAHVGKVWLTLISTSKVVSGRMLTAEFYTLVHRCRKEGIWKSESYVWYFDTTWGRILIRRIQAFSAIAVQTRKTESLKRFLLVDGKKGIVTIRRSSGSSWWVCYRDVEAGNFTVRKSTHIIEGQMDLALIFRVTTHIEVT